MEHGAIKCVKEQSLAEVTIKKEVEVTATSTTAHINSEEYGIAFNIGINHSKQEPVLVESVQSLPVLLVKEEILKENCQNDNEQQCVQVVPRPAATSGVKEACNSGLGDLLNVKYEPVDIDIGPTVLQNMDVHYTINNQNIRVATKENTIVDDCNKATLSSRVKKEIIEDKCRDNKTVSRKRCGHETMDEAHMNSILGQQMFPHKHLPRQHCTTSSNEFKGDRTLQIPQLLSEPNVQRNSAEFSVTTAVAGPSNKMCNDKVGAKLEKGCSSKTISKNIYRCELCHLKIVKSKKIYRCDLCAAIFTQINGLNQQMMVQTGKIHCSTCFATFATSSITNAHESSFGHKICTCTMQMKVQAGKNTYQCTMCGASFKHSSNLTTHIIAHARDKPYRCDTCHVSFKKSSLLSRHMKVHTGIKYVLAALDFINKLS